MSDYSFYLATLAFVASRSDRSDARVAAIMAALDDAAGGITPQGRFPVAAGQLEITARAFAGVAALLQKQILPETIALGHAGAEQQVRWSVDASMAVVNTLLAAAAQGDGNIMITLPPPPAD